MSVKLCEMKIIATPLLLQASDQVFNLALFGHAQGGGRLVHDEDSGVPVNRPANRNRLALPTGEVAHRQAQVVQLDA